MDDEKDVFISYAHIDNEPLTGDQEGWITQFHRVLQRRLRQLLGEDPQIWRDERLQGNDYFANVIVKQLPRVKLLVSVVSPRYVKSDWCLKELKSFYEACVKHGGLQFGDKSRIIKVVKTPFPSEECPKEMEGLLGFNFYESLDENHFKEYDPIFGKEYEIKFVRAVDDLAQSIYRTILASQEGSSIQLPPSARTVYLAETTLDLADIRKGIQRELEQYGHVVLPDHAFAHISPDYEDDVAQALADSRLSIHLVGSRYGIVPDGTDQSTIQLQHKLAVTQAQKAPGFDYLVWMSKSVSSEDPRQQSFIDQLRNDACLLEVPIEELKTIVNEKLENASKGLPKTDSAAEQQETLLYVYLMVDQRDRESALPLLDYLYHQGLEVRLPLLEQDEVQVREDHEENLRSCDAVLMYYGNTSERWLRSKLADIKKAPGFGRVKPFSVKGIYIAPPITPQKQMLLTHEAMLISGSDPFDPKTLEEFLSQLRSG